ncbi:hypothetical protein AAL_05885 [Moelleriella libera RCEF 2490]|uniref:Uncharacterized protein n=1 Tax=Moelleriella libera RCEF 2490 TaxID=1081109 RepID=A0A162IFZ4_9HYPO|nr:hypothetical protein AAL_05885 [Moelleriella libera RCEF 2490]
MSRLFRNSATWYRNKASVHTGSIPQSPSYEINTGEASTAVSPHNFHIRGEERSDDIGQDVDVFIKHRFRRLSTDKGLCSDLRDHLRGILRGIAHGTYLWVYLVLNDLQNEPLKKTAKGLEDFINVMPKSIEEAYERILQGAEGHDRRHFEKRQRNIREALGIVLAASWPLTIQEMNIAMSIEETLQSFQDLDLELDEELAICLGGLCGFFISIYNDRVYFLHQTAREYF